MAATYSQYSSWSPAMQTRYRARYGSAPSQPNTTGTVGGGLGVPYAAPPAPGAPLYGDPGAAAAAGPAPPPPAPPPVFDPYNDPSYVASAGAIQLANQHAQAEHDYQYHQGAQQFGYDAQGNLITSGADLNPYAQAAILKREYDKSVRGTNTSYAAQGQLYSGAIQNAQAANDYGYGQSSDALQRAAQGFYHGQDVSLQGTQDQGLMQLAQMLGPALQNFLLKNGGS